MGNESTIMNLSIIFFVLAITVDIASIIRNLYVNNKYVCAKKGIKNAKIPSTYGFTIKDLKINDRFAGKFRGSVRLRSLNIYTDEEIENMRIKSKQMLP